jgi:phosphoglycolate phosphatase
MGEPLPGDDAARYVIGLGFANAVRHVAPKLDPAAYPAFSAVYRKHYMAGEPSVPLFAGVPQLLEALDAAGYQLAVATGKSPRASTTSWRVRRDQCVPRRCADEGEPKPHLTCC